MSILANENLIFKNNLNIITNYPTNCNINNQSSPIEIPKSPSVDYCLDESNVKNVYYYNLKVTTTTSDKLFSCYNNKEYANLIEPSDKIKYNKLKNFELTVNFLENSFTLKGSINKNTSSYIDSSDKIFIEFSSDANGYTICSCYYLTKDINYLAISPPN